MDLHNKTALVTGGAKRIGAAIARSLSDAGVRVAIHCHESLDEAKALQRLCPGSVVIEADLADRDARDAIVPEAVRALGALDILINNAAVWEAAPLPEIDHAHWDRLIEINLTAPFFLDAQGESKGSGALLLLAVDPGSCQGCGICARVCEDGAIAMASPSPDRVAAHRRSRITASSPRVLNRTGTPDVPVPECVRPIIPLYRHCPR